MPRHINVGDYRRAQDRLIAAKRMVDAAEQALRTAEEEFEAASIELDRMEEDE